MGLIEKWFGDGCTVLCEPILCQPYSVVFSALVPTVLHVHVYLACVLYLQGCKISASV
jgi:hypothetical protein